jgi:hypothetical protein
MHHPGLDPRRRMVLDETQGNPSAPLELPPHVRGSRAGRSPDEQFRYTGIPLPQRLQHIYSARFQTLSETVRAELILVHADRAYAGWRHRPQPSPHPEQP